MEFTNNNIIEVTDLNFEDEVIKSNVPVLVDFYAEWCIPCKKMHPIIEEVKKDTNGSVKICKVDVGNTSILSHFNISSIPAIIFFNNGNIISKKVGLQTKDSLMSMIGKETR